MQTAQAQYRLQKMIIVSANRTSIHYYGTQLHLAKEISMLPPYAASSQALSPHPYLDVCLSDSIADIKLPSI